MKRRRHTAKFKEMVLRHVDRVGSVESAAKTLKLNPSLIYAWRKKSATKTIPKEVIDYARSLEPEALRHLLKDQAEYIRQLKAEIGRLHMLLCRKV